jgi:O-methyltransferase involved in polyketide biosynthesis
MASTSVRARDCNLRGRPSAESCLVDRRLHERGLVKPRNLTRLPIDLEREKKVDHALTANGFDSAKTTFCSLLGVTQYLGRDDVACLLRFVGALNRGSEIVLSFVSPDEELEGIDLDIARRAASRTASFGEPWKYRPRAHDLEAALVSAGFRDVFHLTPELAQARYFVNRTDELRAPVWERLVAAVV